MIEKYGTPRCTICQSANVIDHGDDETLQEFIITDSDGELKKEAVLIKTGKVHYECSECGVNFYSPRF